MPCSNFEHQNTGDLMSHPGCQVFLEKELVGFDAWSIIDEWYYCVIRKKYIYMFDTKVFRNVFQFILKRKTNGDIACDVLGMMSIDKDK